MLNLPPRQAAGACHWLISGCLLAAAIPFHVWGWIHSKLSGRSALYRKFVFGIAVQDFL